MGHHSCCNQQKVKRGLWSPEEDEKLIRYITTHGYGCWSEVPVKAGLQRCGKSCRLRWINYLRPDIRRGRFTQEEEKLIINLHGIVGNRWAHIASHLPGRTDNGIKNYWNSWIIKKIRKQAIRSPLPRVDNIHYGYRSIDQLDAISIPHFAFDTSSSDSNGGSSATGELVQETLTLDTDVWNPNSNLFDCRSSVASNYLTPLIDDMGNTVPMGFQTCCAGENGVTSMECFEKQELSEWLEAKKYPCLLSWDQVLQAQIGGDVLPTAPSNMDIMVSPFP